MTTYPICDKAVELIKEAEGIHDGDLSHIGLQPKMDPLGIWTCGFGRALVNPETGKFLKGSRDKAKAYAMYPNLTVEEANRMLAEDLVPRVNRVKALVKVPLTEDQLGALVSLFYNIGERNFSTSTLRKLLNQGKYLEAAEWFRPFNKGTVNGRKVELRGLTRRRQAERLLFLSGTE